MLPPFLPPSARAATESLPLITEFVVTKTEHSFGENWSHGSSAATATLDAPARELLPPITQFLMADAPSRTETVSEAPSVPLPSPVADDVAPLAEEGWISEERNAFDWQSVATLATRPNEEHRAADEWASTNWEQSPHSESERVAMLLSQIARRVRGGELKVDSTRGMSVEAALAATLAALLKSND